MSEESARGVWALRRVCSCCDAQSQRISTVDCTEHGEMRADDARDGFRCTDGECTAFLSTGDWMRLVDDAPEGSPEPIPLTVPP